MALKRNYPDMTREQVAELLDLSMMRDCMNAVMSVSGMVPKEAAATTGEPTGDSTLTS